LRINSDVTAGGCILLTMWVAELCILSRLVQKNVLITYMISMTFIHEKVQKNKKKIESQYL